MKKIVAVIALVGFTLSTISCRETTENNIEATAETVVEDVEEGLDEAGDTIEDAGQELEEEIEGTDDYNGDDDHN